MPARTLEFTPMRLILCVFLLAPMPVFAAVVDWVAIEASVAKQSEDMVAGRKSGAIGLAIVENGEVRFMHTAGFASRDAKRAFDIDTPVQVGELSRLATAGMAMRLVAKGKLDLDARVVSILPELRWRGATAKVRQMRVRHLLTHHSGLVPNRLHGMFRKPGDPIPSDPLAAPLQLYADPGSMMSTSNLGFEVLGRVLERVSGRDLESLLQTELVAPLGLTRTQFGIQPTSAAAHRKGKTESALIARDRAAVGLSMSLHDLSRLLGALTPGTKSQWLSDSSRREMLRVQNAAVVLDVGNKVGFGWKLSSSVRDQVGTVATLSSTFPNFNAEARLLPKHGIALIAVSNWRESDEEIADLLASATDSVLTAKAGIAPRDLKRLMPDEIGLPAGATADIFGARYATPIGLMEFAQKKSNYDLRFLGFDFRVDRRADGWFGLRFRLLGMIPLKFDAISRVLIRPAKLAGHHVILGFSDGNYFLFGSTFAELGTSPRVEALLGEYRAVNPDALARQLEIETAVLSFDGNMLTLDYVLPFVLSVRPRIALLPRDESHLVMAGFGPSLGEEIDVEHKDGKIRLTVSGYVLEKINKP